MKNKKWLGLICLLISMQLPVVGFASEKELTGSGHVSVESSDQTDPIDPEHPAVIVDPGEGPRSEGKLRFDFVSTLDFGEVAIQPKNRKYLSLAQNFHNKEIGPRGFIVQITDLTESHSGWTLQVVQNNQFKNDIIQNKDEKELTGAVLSFDKSWANSQSTYEAPQMSRDTIRLTNIGESYEVAKAEKGTGSGTWSISFGASSDNINDQPNTLEQLNDTNGKEIIDPIFNKPLYSNSAISLSVPETTKIYPVQYKTELTWLLAKLP